jgi:hypothetical protein
VTVFVATSKRFYSEARQLVSDLRAAGVPVHHPYFDLDQSEVDANPDLKEQVTLRHFPEIDDSHILYAITPGGYVGASVTIELTYAYARGKRIIVSEQPEELALRAMISEVCASQEFLSRFSG